MIAQPLTTFSVGSDVLVDVIGSDAACRLRDVGVREGASIGIVHNNGNVIVRVAGSRIGLRREIARRILAIPAGQ